MTPDDINSVRKKVKELSPLVHCITNPISINQCANGVLGVGARPIMAEHPLEAEEITKTAHALVMNLGNITDVRMKSMLISGSRAKKDGIPRVIDMVGVACSQLRRDFAAQLIKTASPGLIKGNYSEIKALADPEYNSPGVDTEAGLTENIIAKAAVELAQKYNTIVLASGKTDIVTDGNRLVYIKNGSPRLSAVTGTGCMLGALCGCFMAVCGDILAPVAACAVMGISGELSGNIQGTGSFMVSLLDNLSTLSDKDIDKFLKTEEKKIEKI